MPELTVEQAMQIALEHHQAGRFSEAEQTYRQILAVLPNDPESLHLLGVLAGQTGRRELAVELMRRAIAINPSAARYHFNLCVALNDQGRREESIAACRAGLRLEPDNADVRNTLGSYLREAGKLDEAIGAYRHALQLKPHYDFYNNLAMTLMENGQYDEAMIAARQSLELKPDFPEAHWTSALLLLLKGDYERGWREYEWRWRLKSHSLPYDVRTQWDGSDLNGRSILLYTEQGFGDAIQFVRYAPSVAQRGGRVILQCRPELSRLLGSVAGVDRVLAQGEPYAVDVHCPLLSLPLVLGTRVDTIPAKVPYLNVDPTLAAAWESKLGPSRERFRIGLVWAGSPTRRLDVRRSLSLSQLAPLAQVPGVTFYSLQKGSAGNQAAAPPAGMNIVDLAAGLGDFSDTAALISRLDLVIAVDTAVAHLAGALGKPTWVLLHSDWRWLMDREDSPWYPTVRLFRQTKLGDWTDVIDRVVTALSGRGRFSDHVVSVNDPGQF